MPPLTGLEILLVGFSTTMPRLTALGIRAVAPELDHVIANLELLALRPDESKNATVWRGLIAG